MAFILICDEEKMAEREKAMILIRERGRERGFRFLGEL